MRRLGDVRSTDELTVIGRSPAAFVWLALFPFAALASIAFVWLPEAPYGRGLVVLGFTAVVALVALAGLPRAVRLRIHAPAKLEWESGLESDDPYRVVLRSQQSSEVVLEDDDPARVLREARSVAERAQLPFEGPDWVHAAGGAGCGFSDAIIRGPVWPNQARTARAVLGGALFVLLVFLGSIRAESEISVVSTCLPLVSVAAAVLIGVLLRSLEVKLTLSAHGLVAERVLFGHSRRFLELGSADIRGLYAVGHRGYPARHLLIETPAGPLAFALAGDAARQVVSCLKVAPRARESGE